MRTQGKRVSATHSSAVHISCISLQFSECVFSCWLVLRYEVGYVVRGLCFMLWFFPFMEKRSGPRSFVVVVVSCYIELVATSDNGKKRIIYQLVRFVGLVIYPEEFTYGPLPDL